MPATTRQQHGQRYPTYVLLVDDSELISRNIDRTQHYAAGTPSGVPCARGLRQWPTRQERLRGATSSKSAPASQASPAASRH